MTSTTHTEAAIPAWIDLDGLIPAELRQEMQEAREAFEALVPLLGAAATKAQRATNGYEETIQRVMDEGRSLVENTDALGDLVRRFSGWEEMIEAVGASSDLVATALGESPRFSQARLDRFIALHQDAFAHGPKAEAAVAKLRVLADDAQAFDEALTRGELRDFLGELVEALGGPRDA